MTKVKSSKCSQRQNWMEVSQHWCKLEVDTNKHKDLNLNLVFANHGEEGEIYPLTTIEIAKAQQKDQELQVYYKQNAKTPKSISVFNLLKTQKCYARMTN
jgi:hypothetical protein